MKHDNIQTPALIYDLDRISQNCRRIAGFCRTADCRLLYAVKASTFADLVSCVAPHVAGMSASSPFEAQLIKAIAGPDISVHLTSPGLCDTDIASLAGKVEFVSFNSETQLRRLQPLLEPSVQSGLRVNPGMSFVDNARYDPCRAHSKLGMSLDAANRLLKSHRKADRNISGLLIHNNCESEDFSSLVRIAELVRDNLIHPPSQIDWINLGGGYIFDEEDCPKEFLTAVGILKDECNLDVLIEPGAALVRDGAELVAEVVDRFESDGKMVAVLNTTVNHMPEVFEYQYEPDVEGHRDDAPFTYVLSGATCLAGDLFGEYAFDAPLEIGDRVTFTYMGAYTLVKTHWFNGINLPNVYVKSSKHGLEKRQAFTFEDFARHNAYEVGSVNDAVARA